jgi:hypothetical protein
MLHCTRASRYVRAGRRTVKVNVALHHGAQSDPAEADPAQEGGNPAAEVTAQAHEISGGISGRRD